MKRMTFMTKRILPVCLALMLLSGASAARAEAAYETEAFKTAGSIVTFGAWPQLEAGEDHTPIEWLVLEFDEANHRALLLSRYGLDSKPYHNVQADITWEQCALRAWLNDAFLSAAFTAEEQQAILTTEVDNSASQGYSDYSTSGGNDTQDKVFLLSCAEAYRYLKVTDIDFSNLQSRVSPTAYAAGQGAYASAADQTAEGLSAGWWWLRSPGDEQNCASLVDYDGSLYADLADFSGGSVRPALWVDLDSGIF